MPIPPLASQERYYGVLDDSGQHDDQTLIRTISAMLRFQRTMKYSNPLYRPIVMLRNATWARIEKYFEWIDKLALVSRLPFPADAYAEQLRVAGAPEWFFTGFLTSRWADSLRDAHGNFLPKVAWDATLALRNGTAITSAKHTALAEAGARLVRESPTVRPFLTHMTFVVPDSASTRLRGTKLMLKESRISPRLLTAMKSLPLPNGWSRPEFIEAARAEGIWKRHLQAQYVFGTPFAYGYTTVKNRLLVSQIRDSE